MLICRLSCCFLLSGLGSHSDKCQLRDSRSQSAAPLPNALMSSSTPKFRREAVTHRIPLADGTKAQSPGIACIHAVLKQIQYIGIILNFVLLMTDFLNPNPTELGLVTC